MQLIKSINYKYNIILNAKSLTTAGVERNQKRILVPVYNPIFIILSNIPEVTLLKLKKVCVSWCYVSTGRWKLKGTDFGFLVSQPLHKFCWLWISHLNFYCFALTENLIANHIFCATALCHAIKIYNVYTIAFNHLI